MRCGRFGRQSISFLEGRVDRLLFHHTTLTISLFCNNLSLDQIEILQVDMADADSFIPALHKPSSLLPIASHKDALLYTIESNAVTVVVGQTGSGKTTQLPQYLERAGYCNDNKIIAITQACTNINQHTVVYQVDGGSQILAAQTSGRNHRREARG